MFYFELMRFKVWTCLQAFNIARFVCNKL